MTEQEEKEKLKALDELAGRVRKNMPDQKNHLRNVEINKDGGSVVFKWHERMFVVTLPLRVSELKGSALFATGYSMLIQGILAGKVQNEQYIDAALRAITEAEELVRAKNFDAMHQKLEAARSMFRRIIGPASAVAVKAK